MQTILYIVNQLRKAGPVVVLYDLIAHLDRSRYRPVIVKLMEDDPDRSITASFEALGVEVHAMKYSFWDLELRTRSVAKRVQRLAEHLGASVIHTHGYHPVLVASSFRAPTCPRIETMHCISREDFVLSKGFLIGRHMYRRYSAGLNRMEYGAATSQTVQRFYLNHCSRTDIRLVYNGVPSQKFGSAHTIDKAALRQTLGLPADTKIFLAIGALTSGKDPLTIIRAFRAAFPRHAADRPLLVFLGKGPLHEQCLQLIGNDPNILLKGYVFNVQDYLHAADFSVCASHSEGFGLNFIESLMAGVPVIGSQIGPFNEFTTLYPALRSLQFRPGDAAQLAEKLLYAITHPVDLQTITDDALQRFSAAEMARGYMKLYGEAIERQAHRA